VTSQHGALRNFVSESNRIEGITRPPTADEVAAHSAFLALRRPTTDRLCAFVEAVAQAPLRERIGMDVRVGSHVPPRGSPHMRAQVDRLLHVVTNRAWGTPYEIHVRFELLHPFMDGNGRSGRVLWAWCMRRDGQDPLALPFLHRFYYQALDAARRAPDSEGRAA
jgi:Fic/DOC family